MSARTDTTRPATTAVAGRPQRRHYPGWRMVWALAVT
jgi:hypothetical protein